METRGLFVIIISFGFAKNEAVVEEVVEDHSDDVDENENAGAFDEFIRKRNVEGDTDIIGEFIERSNEAKKPSKARAENDGKKSIP